MFVAALESRDDNRVLIRQLRVLPLLELDEDGGVALLFVLAGQDEVDPLGGLRDVILDRDAGVVRDVAVAAIAFTVPLFKNSSAAL